MVYSSCSGNVGLTHSLMKHPVRSGNQKKKTRFAGLFFLTGLRPVLRLRRPPSQLDRPCAPPDVPLTTGSTLRLSTYSFDQTDNMDDRPDRVGERFLNPLRMKHHLRSGNQKKKTHFVGLFFLTGLRPVLRLRRSTPSARCAFGAPPSQLDRPCAPPGVQLTTGSTPIHV